MNQNHDNSDTRGSTREDFQKSFTHSREEPQNSAPTEREAQDSNQQQQQNQSDSE